MLENWTALWEAEWQPVPRWALVAWVAFYSVFLAYVFHSHGGFLFIDMANLVVHEGGHMLFGWFGSTLGFVGRNAAAMARTVIAGGLLLHTKANVGLCVLFLFLF